MPGLSLGRDRPSGSGQRIVTLNRCLRHSAYQIKQIADWPGWAPSLAWILSDGLGARSKRQVHIVTQRHDLGKYIQHGKFGENTPPRYLDNSEIAGQHEGRGVGIASLLIATTVGTRFAVDQVPHRRLPRDAGFVRCAMYFVSIVYLTGSAKAGPTTIANAAARTIARRSTSLGIVGFHLARPLPAKRLIASGAFVWSWLLHCWT